MRADKVLQAAGSFVSILFGISVGVMIADSTTGEGWLFRWQTLVAGLLAVGAAAITVSQMQWTDDRQELRHRDLIKLAVRSDRLKLERAREAIREPMLRGAERLDAVLKTVEGKSGESIAPSPATVFAIDGYEEAFNDFRSAYTDGELNAAVDLFDAATVAAYRKFAKGFGAIQNNIEDVKRAAGKNTGSSFTADFSWEMICTVPKAAHDLLGSLDRLIGHYS